MIIKSSDVGQEVTKSNDLVYLSQQVHRRYTELKVWEDAYWENHFRGNNLEIEAFIQFRKDQAQNRYEAAKSDLWIAR